MLQDINDYLKQFRRQHKKDVAQFREMLLSNLAMVSQIPAPTFHEDLRAEFLLDRFRQAGLFGSFIDDAGNVSGLLKGKTSKRKILLFAHMDTHFPAALDHTVSLTRKQMIGPGLSYNSLGLAVLLSFADMVKRMELPLASDILLLGTTKSQGRGDMEGIRYFIKNHKEKIDAAINVQGAQLGRLEHFSRSRARCDIRCSLEKDSDLAYNPMNVKSAIMIMNELINSLRTIPIPNNPRTVLNIGKISGGESYHGPAVTASISIEIRSEKDQMTNHILQKIQEHCIYVGSQFGVLFDLEIFGKQAAAVLEISHPLVKSAYTILNTLDCHPHMAPTNTEITVLLDQGIPSITIGITTGDNPLLPDGSIDIDNIPTGIMQLLMLVKSIDTGHCDEQD